MLIAAVALLGVMAVGLTGRPLSALARLHLQAVWLVPLALAVQIVTISFTPPGPDVLYQAIHVATYAVLALFVWLNRRVPWLWLVAVGGGCNLAAISVNAGVMPASPAAMKRAGLVVSDGFENSAAVDDARLSMLGDVFATPHWMPLANVFSIGDVLLLIGLVLLVFRACDVGGEALESEPDGGQLLSGDGRLNRPPHVANRRTGPRRGLLRRGDVRGDGRSGVPGPGL